MPLVPATASDMSEGEDHVNPIQLLHGGEHFDDIGGMIDRYNGQRQYNRNASIPLPCDQLHSHVAFIGVT